MKTRVLSAMLAIGAAVVLCSCGNPQSNSASVSVPSEFDHWLSRYFRAMRVKDVSTAEDMLAEVPPKDTQGLSVTSQELRAEKKLLASKSMEKFAPVLGDFKEYKVIACKTRSVTESDPMSATIGAGTHVELLCQTTYSKKQASESFSLYKPASDSEIFAEAHKLTISAQ